MDPKLVREGHDPQLEKAVDTVMEMLKEHPLPEYPRPAVSGLPSGDATAALRDGLVDQFAVTAVRSIL